MPPSARRSEAKHGDENAAPSDSVVEMFGDAAHDPATTIKLEALAALHERKVGALMRSISTQQAEIKDLKNQSREHRRSQLIQDLRKQVREQELAVDVLKEALVEGPRGALSHDAVNELVILRTLGGPKRFRPQTREELQREVAALKRGPRPKRREFKDSKDDHPDPGRAARTNRVRLAADAKDCSDDAPETATP